MTRAERIIKQVSELTRLCLELSRAGRAGGLHHRPLFDLQAKPYDWDGEGKTAKRLTTDAHRSTQIKK